VLHQLGTTRLDGASYTYDLAGNRKTRTDKRLGTTLTYAYDNIYQLLTAKQGTTTKESYTYDPVGNRLSSVGVSPYSYNSSNQLTSIPGTTYTYDNNGNTKTKTTAAGTTTYTWDYENRLTQVVLPGTGGTVTYKYDPFGRRAQKAFTQGGTTTTTNYLYDGMDLLEEVDSSGNVLARYTQGGLDEPFAELRSGTTSYYEQDGINSISSLSNTTGGLINTYAYDSFGKLTTSTGTLANPFQFTGREFDPETGLRYYRARYYDSSTGRFLTEDPAASNAENRYPYVGNNPIIRVDPSGLHSIYYDGSFARVYDDEGNLVLKCRATSGEPGTTTAQQGDVGLGPIPKGRYLIYPEEFSGGTGLHTIIRDFFGNWGTWRIPIHPVPGLTNTFGRDGFFFHGGEHQGSAGCVNLQHCDIAFHDLLANHAGPINVTVNHSGWQPF
jgi:RHS repeat-associated protein